MIESMKATLGIVTASCKQVGIERVTHYRWLKENPEYAKGINESELDLKDFAEGALLQLLHEKNPMIVWNVNKTRNKDRGYMEKQEIEHTGQAFKLIIENPD